MNKNLFPHAQRYIPDSWIRFRNCLKLTNAHYLTWAEVYDLAADYDVLGDSVRECIEYLLDIGEVLWFPQISDLRKIIFHRPRHLVELMRCLFRHDLDGNLNYDRNKVFSAKGEFSRATFEEAKDVLMKYGQISRPMLQCLWFYLDLKYGEFDELMEMMSKFDVGYTIPQPEVPPHKKEFQVWPLMVVPWYVTDIHPEDISDIWPSQAAEGKLEACLTFQFPLYYPLGLLEKLSCRLQEHVDERIDWRDLIWAKSTNTDILIERKLHYETYDFMLALTVRGKELSEVQKSMEFLCLNLYSIMCYVPGMVWIVTADGPNGKDIDIEQCFPRGLFEDQLDSAR